MNWIVQKMLSEDTLSALRVRAGEMIRLSRRAEHPAVAEKLEHLARQYLDLASSIEDDRRHRPSTEPPEQELTTPRRNDRPRRT